MLEVSASSIESAEALADQLIEDLNEHVDIPILNEKQEESLITFLVDSLVNIIDIS